MKGSNSAPKDNSAHSKTVKGHFSWLQSWFLISFPVPTMEEGFLDRSIEKLMHELSSWCEWGIGWLGGVCVRVGFEHPWATGNMGWGEGFSCSKNLFCLMPGGWHPSRTRAWCSLLSAPLWGWEESLLIEESESDARAAGRGLALACPSSWQDRQLLEAGDDSLCLGTSCLHF